MFFYMPGKLFQIRNENNSVFLGNKNKPIQIMVRVMSRAFFSAGKQNLYI